MSWTILKVSLLKTRHLFLCKTLQPSPGFTTDILWGWLCWGTLHPTGFPPLERKEQGAPTSSWGSLVLVELLCLLLGGSGIGCCGSSWTQRMPRCGSARTSNNHREGRCWIPTLSHSPSPALPRLIPTRVTERKKTPSCKSNDSC